MFFSKQKTEDGIVGNYADALKRIKELEAEVERLQYANKAYQTRLVDEYSKASYSVDFAKMNAFSIERHWDNGTQKTIIGYILQEPFSTTEGEYSSKDVVREWNLLCSHEEHERLVKQFNDYVEGGK